MNCTPRQLARPPDVRRRSARIHRECVGEQLPDEGNEGFTSNGGIVRAATRNWLDDLPQPPRFPAIGP
jgi:hypothetical protein